MVTINNHQETYFTNDSKHRRSTYMVSNDFNSHIQFIRYNILIAQNRDIIEDSALMSNRQLDTICNKVNDLKQISSSDIFHGRKAVKADTNKSNPNIRTIHSGFSDDPLEASQISDNYSRQLKLILNVFYKLFSPEERKHLYPYFLTVSKRNCNSGELLSELRGSNASGNHLTDNFRKNMKTILDFIRYHYPIVGGVSKTEITINKINLLEEISENLFHDHQHILLISRSPIDVHKLRHGNFYNRFIFNKVEEVFGKDSVSKLAFDLRPISVENGNLGDAVVEISKYASKPQMYQSLKYVSERDVQDNNFDEFHLKAFAEIRGAIYNLHLKGKFGIFDKIDKFITRLGRIKPAIRAAIANSPSFNINNRRTFGKVLAKEGFLVWASGKKEQGHWKMINFKSMDDKTFLYSNSQLISKILLSSQQLSWLHFALHNFDMSNVGVKKDSYFDRIANYLESLPFLNSVNDLIDWVKSVADNKMKEAKSYLLQSASLNSDSFHSYQMKRNDAYDMYRLVECIHKYSNEDGLIKLGLHTNPDFKFKVYQWIQTYKGALSYLGFSITKGWRYLGGLYNGQKDVVDEFTDEQQRTCRKAMAVADKGLDYLEMSPQPRELICLDRVGCFLNCDTSDYKDKDLVPLNKGAYLDEDTGEVVSLIDSSNYNMLTAPSFDSYNWSEDGTGFDINLFSDIKSSDCISDIIYDALTIFTKSHITISKDIKPKKMANSKVS